MYTSRAAFVTREGASGSKGPPRRGAQSECGSNHVPSFISRDHPCSRSHWVPPIGGEGRGRFYLSILISNTCMKRGSRTTQFGMFHFIFYVTVWEALSVGHRARKLISL